MPSTLVEGKCPGPDSLPVGRQETSTKKSPQLLLRAGAQDRIPCLSADRKPAQKKCPQLLLRASAQDWIPCLSADREPAQKKCPQLLLRASAQDRIPCMSADREPAPKKMPSTFVEGECPGLDSNQHTLASAAT